MSKSIEKQPKRAKLPRAAACRRAVAAVSAARSETLSARNRPHRLRRNYEVASDGVQERRAIAWSHCATSIERARKSAATSFIRTRSRPTTSTKCCRATISKSSTSRRIRPSGRRSSKRRSARGKHVLSQKPFVLDLDVGAAAGRSGRRNGREAGRQSKRPLGAPLQLHSRSGPRRPARLDRRHPLRRPLGPQLGQRHAVRIGPPPDPVRLRASTGSTSCDTIMDDAMPRADLRLDGPLGHADDQARAAGPSDHRIRIDASDAHLRRLHALRSPGPHARRRQPRRDSQRGPEHRAPARRNDDGRTASLAPRLKGAWFPDGFHGTMAELLSAIDENREPSNSARNNLASLALCFAAVASANAAKP